MGIHDILSTSGIFYELWGKEGIWKDVNFCNAKFYIPVEKNTI